MLKIAILTAIIAVLAITLAIQLVVEDVDAGKTTIKCSNGVCTQTGSGGGSGSVRQCNNGICGNSNW
jgi:hypothetical protein